MRIQKAMALRGVGSRRACEAMIEAGRVAVNGEIVTRQGVTVEDTDVITVDGVPLKEPERKRYILLHKPVGMMCTASDPQGRPTVVEHLGLSERVYPVGRLDFDTQGALLLTNDGELARALTHPSVGVEKKYVLRVRSLPPLEALKRLRQGVYMEGDPRRTLPCQVDVLRSGPMYADLRVVLREGRNRQVRRMLEAVGYPVLSLRRETFAGLSCEGLAPGEFRDLSGAEVRMLREKVEKAAKTKAKAGLRGMGRKDAGERDAERMDAGETDAERMDAGETDADAKEWDVEEMDAEKWNAEEMDVEE